MAHITNYTFSKLCNKLDLKKDVDLDFFINHVYNDKFIFYILNKVEIKYLFNYKNMLEDDQKYFTEYYRFVPEKFDTQRFVFESKGKLKYHLSADCALLKKDYVNYYIPIEIQEIGETAVNDFRNWFKSQSYMELYKKNQLDIGKVVFDYNMLFPSKYNVKPLNEKYKLVAELGNSDSIVIESNYDYEIFKSKLEHLKKQFTNIFSCKVSRILSKHDYLLKKSDQEINAKMKELFSDLFVSNYGMETIKDKLKLSKNIKSNLKQNLLEYFKWTYKSNKNGFDNSTLENFGLVCCEKCLEEKHVKNIFSH